MTSRVLTLFDPSQATSGTIQTQTGDPFWQLVIWNESQYALRLVFRDGSSDVAPAFVGSYWRLQDPTDVVQWSIQATIPGNAPLSLCMVILYDPDTRLPANFPVSLSRLTNIGNQVSTTAIPQVINDGNAAPTTVLEASPSGSGTQALINNDGSATLGGGLIKINNAGQITAIPNGALPMSALTSGALPTITANTLFQQVGVANQVNDFLEMKNTGANLADYGLWIDGVGNWLVRDITNAKNPLVVLQNGAGLTYLGTLSGPAHSIPLAQLATGALPTSITVDFSQMTGTDPGGGGGGVATQVDTTNANNQTVPQIKASSTTGLGIKDNGGTAPNVNVILYPTENDGVARGLEFGYVDSGGVLHGGAIMRTNGVFAGQVMDGSASSLRQTAHYIGTTDPSTYVTVNEGDTWDNA